MTERGESRLDRLERALDNLAKQGASTHLLAATLKSAIEHLTREGRERRGRIEKVIASQTKLEAAVERTELKIDEDVKPQLEKTQADVARLTASQIDIPKLKAAFDRDEIKRHEKAGASKLRKKQWGWITFAAGIFVWLIGEFRGWWPHLWGLLWGNGKPPH